MICCMIPISDLGQKILSTNQFPGIFLIGNIWKTKNARAWKKYFSRRIFKRQSVDISF